MTTPIQSCKVPGCDYSCQPGNARQQWDELQNHLNANHFKGSPLNKSTTGDTMAAPIQRMWLSLDEYMREVKESETSDTAKAKARGYAECMVHILPQPLWPDADTIILHSQDRYDAFKASQPMPSTPGFLPQNNDLDYAYGTDFLKLEKEIADIGSRPKKETKSKLNDVTVSAIKKALEGGFEVEMLASTYGVSKADIEALRP